MGFFFVGLGFSLGTYAAVLRLTFRSALRDHFNRAKDQIWVSHLQRKHLLTVLSL